MMKKWGLFAVEQMQTEFPGYTHEQFNEDLKRKKAGKRKKNRRKKLIGFDYKLLMYHVPWFVRGALSKQKTKIRARFSTKKAVLIVEIHWKIYGEYGEGTLLTGNLIKLLNGSVKDLCEHPNVFVTHIQQHDESIH